MRIHQHQIYFEHQGEHYLAILAPEPKGGVILNPHKPQGQGQWWMQLNATATEVLEYLETLGVNTTALLTTYPSHQCPKQRSNHL